MSDFDDFEADVADVPDPFDEVPSIEVEAELVAHLVELVAHFAHHVVGHLDEAMTHGLDTVNYTTASGADLVVRRSHTKLLIQYSIPPDVADEIVRRLSE